MGVPEQRLNAPKVTAVLEEMRGERMAKRVGPDPLAEPGAKRRVTNRSLNDGWIEMPAATEAGAWVVDQAGPGKHVLPPKIGGCCR